MRTANLLAGLALLLSGCASSPDFVRLPGPEEPATSEVRRALQAEIVRRDRHYTEQRVAALFEKREQTRKAGYCRGSVTVVELYLAPSRRTRDGSAFELKANSSDVVLGVKTLSCKHGKMQACAKRALDAVDSLHGRHQFTNRYHLFVEELRFPDSAGCKTALW